MNSAVEIDDYMKNLMLTIGVPAKKINEQQVLPKLLRRVYTQKEGELVIKIGKNGGTIPELADKLDMSETEVYEKLNHMFINEGTVHPEPDKLKGVVVWKPTTSMQMHDLVFMNKKYTTDEYQDVWPLLDEYYETVMGPVIASANKTLFRIIPVHETITSSGSNVLPYEEAAKIIDMSRKIALADCVCRKRARDCDHPKEVCMNFDLAADIMLQRNISKQITKKDAYEVLRISEEAGLMHCVDNRQHGLFFICNCCSCACGAVRAATVHGSKNALVPSRYKAIIDADGCSGCGVCLEKCQINAISLKDGVAVIDDALCLGCGNCAVNCTEGIIAMKEIRPPEHIPEKGDSFMGF